MKNKILQIIKDKLGNTVLSERTLAQRAERLSRKYTTDEALTDDVIKEFIEDLKADDGQARHEIAEGFKKAEEKFKAEYEQKLAESLKGEKTPPGGAEKTEYEKLSEQLAALTKSLSDIQAEKAEQAKQQKEQQYIQTVSEAVKKELSKNGDLDKTASYIMRNVLSQIAYKEGADLAAETAEWVKRFDSECKEVLGDGATPRTGSGGGGGDAEAKKLAMAAYKESLIQEGKLPKIEKSN